MEDLQFNETILCLNAEFVQTYTAKTDIRCGTRSFCTPLHFWQSIYEPRHWDKTCPSCSCNNIQKELWFIKAGRFSLFYKYVRRGKINVHICFPFLFASISFCLFFLCLHTGLIVYSSVHPSPLCVCDCEISIFPSTHLSSYWRVYGAFIPHSWLISLGLEGLWKPPVYRPYCPLKSATDSH